MLLELPLFLLILQPADHRGETWKEAKPDAHRAHPSPPRLGALGQVQVQSDAKLRPSRAVLKSPATGLT